MGQQEGGVEPDTAGVVMGTVGRTHVDTESGKRLGSHRKAAPGSLLPCPPLSPPIEPQSISAWTQKGDRPAASQKVTSEPWPWEHTLPEGASLLCPITLSGFSLPKRKLQASYCSAQDRGLWSLNSLLQAMFEFLT